MSQPILFIHNPISGGRRNNFLSVLELVKELFENSKVISTTHKGHAAELATQYKTQFDIIVAVGGDGTINEVASVLVNTNVTMGIIPQGSGNGFANYLKISRSTKKALGQLANGSPKKIDTVAINNNTFINVAGVGFDGHIANLFENSTKRGFWSYVKLILTEFLSYKEFSFTLQVNEKTLKGSAFIIALANSSQYGNNFYVAPNATAEDGLLNVIIFKKPSIWIAPLIAYRMFRGKTIGSRYAKELIGNEFILTHQAKSLQLDGEIISVNSNRLNLKVQASSLLVIC